LRAVSELRSGLQGLEADYVDEAVRSGLPWSRVAQALGVSRQAAHKRHSRRLRPADLGVSLTVARSDVERLGGDPGRARSSDHGHADTLLPTARGVLEQSLGEAVRSGSDRLDVEYLLRGLLKEDGAAVRVLKQLGLSGMAVERRLSQLITSQRP
jgi:hypothetical protein